MRWYLDFLTCKRQITFLALGLTGTNLAAQDRVTHPDSVEIVTVDISNFWRAYDRLHGAGTRAESLQIVTDEYLEPASLGLQEYVRIRLNGPENVVRALGLAPNYYAAVRPHTMRLGEHTTTIRESARALHRLYPRAVFPPVYFLMSGFISQGTLTDQGLYIGAEMVAADKATPLGELPPPLRAVDLTTNVLPCIVTHELVHYQQEYGPGRSLLAQVVREGVADFVAVQAIGCTSTAGAVYAYGDGHEAALWAEFRRVMGGRDMEGWLYNGNTASDRPPNLGYWMGYQLAEAYYERVIDKQQAIHDLLHIDDFVDSVTRSGYSGGTPQ